jgi:hypothetical protein
MRIGLIVVAMFAASPVLAQQPDPAKLLPIAIAQRDQANTQVLYCASQNNELSERIKQLEAEIAKLKQ